MSTTIHFDDSHSIKVDEDLNAVESTLMGAPPGVAGLVKFQQDGQPILVNAARVRTAAETRSGSAFG